MPTRQLVTADLALVKSEMRKIIKAKYKFTREEISRSEARYGSWLC